jgi:uncharacterized protein
MFVAVCQIHLHLGGVASLKEKRSIVKSVTSRLGQEFRLSAAEVAHHDVWQTAGLALAAVGNDQAHLHRTMEAAVAWLVQHRPDVTLQDYTIEFR